MQLLHLRAGGLRHIKNSRPGIPDGSFCFCCAGLFRGHGADHEVVVHLLGQVALVEELVVLGDLGLEVILAVVGVEQGAQPEHAEVALHGRGAGEPAVGAVGGLVVVSGADGGQLLPGRVGAHGVVDGVGREDDDVRVPDHDLLQVHLVAVAGGDDLGQVGQVVGHEVDGLGVVGALGDDVQAFVAQAVEQALAGAVGVDLGHHVGHHGVGLLAPGRELLGLLGLAGQLAEHAVGLRRGLDGGVDVDKGDAGLLGQAVHVLGDAVLGVAHVDDDVGVGGQQGLEVHLALAAVELAELGQLGDVGGQIERYVLGDVVRHADHEVAHQRDGVDLRQRAGCIPRTRGSHRHCCYHA